MQPTTISRLALASLCACLPASLSVADTTTNNDCQARALFQNHSSENSITQAKLPGLVLTNGHRHPLTGGAVTLTESAFGQSFSTWYPSETWATETIAAVKAALYPSDTATTRLTIQNSGKPFRYKWLMYTGSSDTDVTAFDATSIAGWFTDADRAVITAQIAVLKKAVSASPLDTSLRTMLLDVYYDLAVAEMQAVKPKLAGLARLRLGLEVLPQGKFIIDEEIRIYEEITVAVNKAIDQYSSLLKDTWPGMDPGMFDPRPGAAGTPMGRYLFIRQQPLRNSTPSQFANGTGVFTVPEFSDPDGSGPLPESVQRQDAGDVVFNGYKDLKMLWDILGQSLQHEAELMRLRGSRQAPGDLAAARRAADAAMKRTGTELQIIRAWFPELFPANYNGLAAVARQQVDLRLQQSGVLASESALATGLNEIRATTPFLNGTSNILGYDPEFLLLVQDNTNSGRESYDVLKEMLVGTNKPLTAALEKLGTSTGLYNAFQEKVDRVAADIDDADEALADRFYAITGFEPDAEPAFDPKTMNAEAGSELAQVLLTIKGLDEQATLREGLTDQLNELTKEAVGAAKGGAAVQAVNDAEKKEAALLNAGQAYKNTTSGMYEEKIGMAAGAAASQAAYDAWVNTANTPTETLFFSGGAVAAVTAVAGGINTAMQTAAAAVIGQNERDIDYASIDFTVTTESVDAALAVNQARQELSSLKREQISNTMAGKADLSAKAQAEAQKAALLAELDRIQKQRDGNVSAIRKKSYADPLHYQRAEAALIDADESFRTAQRWMFYTLRALEYKWHGRFAITQGSKSWDTGSVFRARNAAELNDLLTQMNLWDQTRVTQTTNSPVILTRISLLEHMLARNPNRHETNPADPGTRIEGTYTVSTLQYFRNRLAKHRDPSGNFIIPINTAISSAVEDQIDGNFFIGATYNSDNTVAPGFWREKIQYLKVNIIAEDAPAAPRTYAGNLTYGGTTYFRTRVPPCADRRVLSTTVEDQAGDLMIAPFRFWVSPDFSQNFTPLSEQTVSIPIAYGQSTGLLPGSGSDLLSSSYEINDFDGRSIAASGWELRINKTQSGGQQVDPARIKDIEIIIAYKHSSRVPPVCP